jgi:predicted PurR-regulated permease PerM
MIAIVTVMKQAALPTKADRDKRLSVLCLILATVVDLYLIWVIARPFLSPIVAAVLLAIAIYPFYARLRRRIPSASGSAFVATLFVLIAILVPTGLIVSKVAHDSAGFYSWLNERQSHEGSWSALVGSLVDPSLTWVASKTGLSDEQLRQAALDRVQTASAALLQWAKVSCGQHRYDDRQDPNHPADVVLSPKGW